MRGPSTVSARLMSLDELVPHYAENKQLADAYKKAAEADNGAIKSALNELGMNTYSAGGYTVTMSTSKRESLDEERLVALAEKHGWPVTKTVVVIDPTMLEDFLYNQEASLSPEQRADLMSCKKVTNVVSLRKCQRGHQK